MHLESFHQFTNLKIIKAEKNESQDRSERPATSPRAKSKTGDSEIKTLNVEVREKAPKNKVYSQVIEGKWKLMGGLKEIGGNLQVI
jgi:hypothetical protein